MTSETVGVGVQSFSNQVDTIPYLGTYVIPSSFPLYCRQKSECQPKPTQPVVKHNITSIVVIKTPSQNASVDMNSSTLTRTASESSSVNGAPFPPRPKAVATFLSSKDFLPGCQTLLHSIKVSRRTRCKHFVPSL